jgi:transmembrane 9 superfamily protein 2/4
MESLGRLLVLPLLPLFARPASAFYLPGVAPREFHDGAEVALKVDKLTSVKSQLPYGFYDAAFCTPAEAGIVDPSTGKAADVHSMAENLGEVLAGNRMESSGYKLSMKEHTPGCEVLCRKTFTKDETDKLAQFIRNDYRVNMWLDNLPVAQKLFNSQEAMTVDAERMQKMRAGESVEPLTPDEQSTFVYTRGYAIGAAREDYIDATNNGDSSPDDDGWDGMHTSSGDRLPEDVKDGNGLLPGEYLIHNHLQFLIRYHEFDPNVGDSQGLRGSLSEPQLDGGVGVGGIQGSGYEGARIVGFEVVPMSVKHEWNNQWNGAQTYLKSCNGQVLPTAASPIQKIVPGEENQVVFTYRTSWYLDSSTPWSERWDIYFQDQARDNDIHWFSITNSVLIVLMLSFMVGLIIMRALNRDISAYNDETLDDLAEETGWKLVHGDVFRGPKQYPMLLSVFIGCGSQLFLMTLIMLIFACLGFLSPANRGGLLTALIFLFVFAGVVSGYKSARLYKLFDGKDWKRNALLSAFLLPGAVFVIGFALNLIVWSRQSVGAIPFTTLIALVLLWFCVSTPLTFIGSYFGFSKDTYELPCKSHQIPRQIPEQPWYMHPICSTVVGGILPFGAIFIEVFFVMSALWMHTIYYVFGFLFIVLIILVITCAEISIVMCYFQLCSEDYAWWWRSFFTSASVGGYVFLYSIAFFSSKLELSDAVSTALYFGYMGIISIAFSILTGTIGFEACFWFTKKIFGAIKID